MNCTFLFESRLIVIRGDVLNTYAGVTEGGLIGVEKVHADSGRALIILIDLVRGVAGDIKIAGCIVKQETLGVCNTMIPGRATDE